MSDIFISYAHIDRAMAEALAKDLTALGYRVWWDAELVGSDDFYEVILQALNNAKAAIVIWTKSSAKSKYVYDEARFADHLKKLIATRDPLLDPIDIPFGFGRQQTDDVTDREKVVRGLDKLGVKPAGGAASADWEKVKAGGSIDDVVAYLGSNPPEPQRQAAVARLKELSDGPEGTKGSSAVVHSLTMSNWRAFLSGLTFRLPKFQLSAQGTWGAVGTAVAYVAVIIVAAVTTVGLVGNTIASKDLGQSIASAAIVTAVFLFLVVVAWNRFGSFLTTKSVGAASVMAVSIPVLAVYLAAPFAVALQTADSNGNLKTGFNEGFVVATVGIAFCLSLVLVIRKFRAAR